MPQYAEAEKARLTSAIEILNGFQENGSRQKVSSKFNQRVNRDSDVLKVQPASSELESLGSLIIPNSSIRVDYGLGSNGNYINVYDANGLSWDEGFHRNTHNLSSDDVTGWNSGRPEYGVFFAVRYGRNRDLFQFYRLKVENGVIVVKTPFWDSYSRGDHIELEWAFDRNDSIICKTKPYGHHGDAFRWAYNFNPATEQWSGFEI